MKRGLHLIPSPPAHARTHTTHTRANKHTHTTTRYFNVSYIKKEASKAHKNRFSRSKASKNRFSLSLREPISSVWGLRPRTSLVLSRQRPLKSFLRFTFLRVQWLTCCVASSPCHSLPTSLISSLMPELARARTWKSCDAGCERMQDSRFSLSRTSSNSML